MCSSCRESWLSVFFLPNILSISATTFSLWSMQSSHAALNPPPPRPGCACLCVGSAGNEGSSLPPDDFSVGVFCDTGRAAAFAPSAGVFSPPISFSSSSNNACSSSLIPLAPIADTDPATS